MWANIDSRINSALNRIRLAFRTRLTRVNSAGPVQTIQANGLAGEQLQDAELFQHYGFTSVPPAGTAGIVIPLGGMTSHSIVIATEHGEYRVKSLKNGEVSIYTLEGTSITLKNGRIITVECDEYQVNCKKYVVNASDRAEFDTPVLHGSNEVSDGKSTMNVMRGIHNSHNHAHGGDAGITAPPIQQM
ncbi:phage baseplate assembly protein V [Lonsdalea britannica]|uniref:phage baseplate assembly protein V n=1 Tax=Lonsdalea britannica TaxID=1082704 RepID=UPI0026EE09A1|nr:phage baseplate assembly protein V [Lonsdalea britannica]